MAQRAEQAPVRIEYSEKYQDNNYEYRHVTLKEFPKEHYPAGYPRLLNENEWRNLGVQQSHGWTHYAIHRPEPNVLLFRRPLGTDPLTGMVDPELLRKAREDFRKSYENPAISTAM